VAIALAPLLSAVFGAGDQYLGSLTGSGHGWPVGWSSDVSLLSAPWLVLPFLAGATQRA
jgi:PPE-repeat protein